MENNRTRENAETPMVPVSRVSAAYILLMSETPRSHRGDSLLVNSKRLSVSLGTDIAPRER